MAPAEFRTRASRPSEAERDRALGVLRDSVGNGRMSHDTFMGRMELVLTARSQAELDHALHDLQTAGRVSALALRTVGRISAFTARLRRTWHTEQLPGLRLPPPGTAPLRIGRVPGSDLRLTDGSVSRRHAELRYEADGWTLHDLGSTNGTHVNGLRVAGAIRVHPGDQVRFGRLSFRLAAG